MDADRTAAGRTAIVTGAGSGIGRAVALRLARCGARVVAVGRDAARLAETRALAGSDEVVALAADVREPASVGALPAEVDMLVHVAAAFPPYRRVEDVTDGDLEEAVATSLAATLRLVRHALPGMRARGHGRIVCVGSHVARVGGRGQLAYATAKAGLVGLVRTVALEAARDGVTCNLVEPGLVDTERTRAALTADARAALLARIPAGRAGTPEEVAAVVAALCADTAGYVTGARVPVTGGLDLGVD